MGYQNIPSVIRDPAETILADGAGHRLGYSRATSVLTEFPKSVCVGGRDGFEISQGPIVGPSHRELNGLGEDSCVTAFPDRFGRTAGGAAAAATLPTAR